MIPHLPNQPKGQVSYVPASRPQACRSTKVWGESEKPGRSLGPAPSRSLGGHCTTRPLTIVYETNRRSRGIGVPVPAIAPDERLGDRHDVGHAGDACRLVSDR